MSKEIGIVFSVIALIIFTTVIMTSSPLAPLFESWDIKIYIGTTGSYIAKDSDGIVLATTTNATELFTDMLSNSENRTILVMNGNYTITGSIGVNVTNAVNLRVIGYQNPVLKKAPSSDNASCQSVLEVSFGVQNATFKGLTFDQNRDGLLETTGYGLQWTVRVVHNTDVTFEDVTIRNSIQNALVAGNATNLSFLNSKIDVTGEHGVYMSDNSAGFTLANSRILNWAHGTKRGYALKLQNFTDVTVTNLILDQNEDEAGYVTSEPVGGGSYSFIFAYFSGLSVDGLKAWSPVLPIDVIQEGSETFYYPEDTGDWSPYVQNAEKFTGHPYH